MIARMLFSRAFLTRARIQQLWYVPLLTVALGLMMVRMLVMARVLRVQEFALFSGAVLVSSTFCMLGCLGMQSMLQREWPVNLLRGQERRGLVLAAQCNVVALGCAVILLLMTVTGASFAGLPPVLLAFGILHGFSQQVFLIATVESRSRGDVVRFARDNLIRAGGALAFGTAAALITGMTLWVLAVEAVISMILAYRYFSRAARIALLELPRVYFLAVRSLRRVRWRSALALMAVSVLSFISINADRWFAAETLEAASFAQYAFAWIVLIVAQGMQAVGNAAVFPMLARRFAGGGCRAAFRLCLALSLAVLAGGSICSILVWEVASIAVPHWFPDYEPAIGLLPLFLAIGVLRLSDFWSSYLLVIGREAWLLVANIAVLIAASALWAAIVRPWNTSERMNDIALLALAFSLFSYAMTAGMASRSRLGRNADS